MVQSARGNDDSQLSFSFSPRKLNQIDKHEHVLTKTIKIFDSQLDIVKEIFVEEVTSYQTNPLFDGDVA